MSAPSVGLALIVKDEQEGLPRLLDSIRGAFDRVVLVDTGSTDNTVELFKSWAADEVGAGRLGSYLDDRFTWKDNFAAARQYAHARLGTDWEVWADADDTIPGAENLRGLAAQAPDHVDAFIADYAYAHDQHGNVVCSLRRERLVRAGKGRWSGWVHEAQEIDGQAVFVDPETLLWVHAANLERHDPGRNLRILRKWVKHEPENPRVLAYLGTEELTRGRPKQAIRWYRRYLKLKGGWDEERAQIHRKLALAQAELGRDDQAITAAMEAVLLLPTWPDSYLTLAEAHYRQGKLGKAMYWADQVLERGVPQTLLIINPQDYTVAPLGVKAAALAAAGETAAAVEQAEQVLATVPDHPVAAHFQGWRAQLKRERTAESFIRAAEMLSAHDEQLKALAVLEAVPHFAYHHEQVVAHRSRLRERIGQLEDPDGYREHYETGGSKPEDMVPDERVLELGDALPRCQLLLSGLDAQRKAAA